MSFKTNKKAFLDPANPDSILSIYCTLVGVELALKDANISSPSGHDVPAMLQQLSTSANGLPIISAQLNSLIAQLKLDLSSVTCQGKNGQPISVPAHSYPYLRYSRQTGDWGGVGETSGALIVSLESTCRNLRAFLTTHGTGLGVQL